MRKILCRNLGGQVTPVAPSWGRPCLRCIMILRSEDYAHIARNVRRQDLEWNLLKCLGSDLSWVRCVLKPKNLRSRRSVVKFIWWSFWKLWDWARCITCIFMALKLQKICKKKFSLLQNIKQSYNVFTARCYASAVLAMALCPSVRPSQVGVLLKRLNVGSHKQHRTIAQGL